MYCIIDKVQYTIISFFFFFFFGGMIVSCRGKEFFFFRTDEDDGVCFLCLYLHACTCICVCVCVGDQPERRQVWDMWQSSCRLYWSLWIHWLGAASISCWILQKHYNYLAEHLQGTVCVCVCVCVWCMWEGWKREMDYRPHARYYIPRVKGYKLQVKSCQFSRYTI